MAQVKLNHAASAASVVVEVFHVFCCGLPMLFAVLSASTQVGLGSGFLFLHDTLHNYETFILFGSGLVLTTGLILQYVSFHIDCRTTGCTHGTCEPKKMHISWIFTIAVVVYVVNLSVYFVSGHSGLEGVV